MKRFLSWLLWPFNVMLSECAYCGRVKGLRYGNRGITSGICGKCYRAEMAKMPSRHGRYVHDPRD